MPATISPTTRGGQEVDSSRAGGRYFISSAAQTILQSWDQSLRARLTTWLIDQRRLSAECPEVLSNTLDNVRIRRPLSVHQRADRLLAYFEEASTHIGDEIAFDHDDANFMEMSAWCESILPDEVDYLLQFLERRGFISLEHVGDDAGSAKISVDGYARLAELEEKAVNAAQAFVAMWFDESMVGVYENGIASGIDDAGYTPTRIDRKDHNNKIDDEIIAEIRRSRFVVADFTHGATGVRGGVYYEAGFGHGLNIPVIFTCREDIMSQVHFDTRQYNHIAWKTPEELRERLANRISATIGDGPLKKS